MTMITPSYLGETIEYSSLHACRSTLEDPTFGYEASTSSDSDVTENNGAFRCRGQAVFPVLGAKHSNGWTR